MEIVHNSQNVTAEVSPFSVTYGTRSPESVLQNMEKNLLNQMGNVFSIIHGGEFKKRRTYIHA